MIAYYWKVFKTEATYSNGKDLMKKILFLIIPFSILISLMGMVKMAEFLPLDAPRQFRVAMGISNFMILFVASFTALALIFALALWSREACRRARKELEQALEPESWRRLRKERTTQIEKWRL
jgi:uncharacterized membrane protein